MWFLSVLNSVLQSPGCFVCKHLVPNHVPVQSRKFCRVCSHPLIHCGRPSHDEQPEKQSNKTGSSRSIPRPAVHFSPIIQIYFHIYSNYWNYELHVIYNLIIWVSEYACRLILDNIKCRKSSRYRCRELCNLLMLLRVCLFVCLFVCFCFSSQNSGTFCIISSFLL